MSEYLKEYLGDDEKPRGRGVLMTREPLGPGIRFYWMCGVCSRRIARCANV